VPGCMAGNGYEIYVTNVTVKLGKGVQQRLSKKDIRLAQLI